MVGTAMAPDKQQFTDDGDSGKADGEKLRDLAEKIGQAPKEEIEEAKRREKEKKDAEKR